MTSEAGHDEQVQARGHVPATEGPAGLPGPEGPTWATGREPVRVPRAVEIATAWSWRLLVIGAAAYVALFLVIGNAEVVATPLLLGVLIAALLQPLFRLLRRMRVPRYPAAGVSLVVFVALVVAIVAAVSQQIASEIGDVGASAAEGLDQLLAVVSSLLGISEETIQETVDGALSSVVDQSAAVLSGLFTATGTATSILTGVLLTLFAVFFYLGDGDRIWRFLLVLLPRDARGPMDAAGRGAWSTLTAYVRAVPVVAFADALGIGLGAALLGVPFALPIAVVTFLGAFVPLVGAIITGILAVLVALVTEGVVDALILLVIVFAVQQTESYLLQPLLLGRAVRMYPLAIVASISTGILLAGIVGGVLAVPVLAVSVAFVRSLAAGAGRGVVPESPLGPLPDIRPPGARSPDPSGGLADGSSGGLADGSSGGLADGSAGGPAEVTGDGAAVVEARNGDAAGEGGRAR